MIDVLNDVKKLGRTILTEIEAKQVISDTGIKVVPTQLAKTQK